MMKLTNLLEEFHGTQAEYLDIINYEIARENICGYIFLLSRISQNAEPTERMQLESKIEDLIYYRDNLQIEDKENIQKVLNELIPEYKAEQEQQRAKKDTIKQQNSQQLQNKQQHKEKTLEQGFNRVEQGFEQWKKAQEVKRLELERKQQLKLQQEQAMKQKHRKSMKRSGPSL